MDSAIIALSDTSRPNPDDRTSPVTNENVTPRMKHFEKYVQELEKLASAALTGQDALLEKIDYGKYLNGNVGIELRKRVQLDRRQEIGAFFTGEALRQRAVPSSWLDVTPGLIWDPACGAGDLLLSYAEKIRIFPDIRDTLVHWGEKLCGTDIEAVFLRAAKARLVLAAYSRGARRLGKPVLALSSTFPHVQQGDSLSCLPPFAATEIIVNPPFISSVPAFPCSWGSGGVSAAALFIDRCLKASAPGARISAILPDVLRTGSRYGRWRNFVLEFAEIKRLDVYGTFDPQADVDVFILELAVRRRPKKTEGLSGPWGVPSISSSSTLADYCSVSVGTVVPHRHREIGPEHPYLHAKDAPQWGAVENIESRRRFTGTTFRPPFVVIRRTSSPNDKFRAIGTLIQSPEPVAVENHLLVCKPHDGSIETCRAILEALRSGATTEWLNSRIRCRHLTVGAVQGIPMKLKKS